jgi:hypothetical protein
MASKGPNEGRFQEKSKERDVRTSNIIAAKGEIASFVLA